MIVVLVNDEVEEEKNDTKKGRSVPGAQLAMVQKRYLGGVSFIIRLEYFSS